MTADGGAFCVRFCLCFLFFSGFLGFLFGSGGWAPCCSFFVGLLVCVSFVMKAILLFFWTIFLIFGPFFLFHFCFDLPQVSNCYESDSFHFFGLFFLNGAFFGVFFWLWVLGAALLLFPSGFLVCVLFVFSLLF